MLFIVARKFGVVRVVLLSLASMYWYPAAMQAMQVHIASIYKAARYIKIPGCGIIFSVGMRDRFSIFFAR